MTTQNIRFLAKTANLYYKEGLSQAEIAKRLCTSRASIGRALKTAEELGYIRVVFDFPAESHFGIDLERQIETAFGLKEVIIADETTSSSLIPVADEAALYLARSMKNHYSVGITWGRTMEAIIHSFDKNDLHKDIKFSDIEIIPFTGTAVPSTANVEELRLTYSSLLSSRFAEILKGRSYPFPAPLYVRSKNVRDILLKEPEIDAILQRGRNCDVAVFGIGMISEISSITALDPELTASILDLTKHGAVGEIMGHAFDAHGNSVPNEVSSRIIGISLENLKKIPQRIAVVYGKEKAQAIRAVCRSKLANVLITDTQTAFSLLESEE